MKREGGAAALLLSVHPHPQRVRPLAVGRSTSPRNGKEPEEGGGGREIACIFYCRGGGGKRGHGDRRQGHRTFPVHFFRRRRLLSEAAEFSSPELAPLRSSSQ